MLGLLVAAAHSSQLTAACRSHPQPLATAMLQVPLEVLQHLASGLTSVGKERKNKQTVPPGWEGCMRELLLSEPARGRILGLQRPLEACRADLFAAVAAALGKLRGAAATAVGDGGALSPAPSLPTALAQLSAGGGAEAMEVDGGAAAAGAGGEGGDGGDGRSMPSPPVRYIAIAGFDAVPLREAAAQLLPPQIAAALKPSLHVTLWHSDDLDMDDVRDALVAEEWEQAAFEVVALDWSEEVTAAEVRGGGLWFERHVVAAFGFLFPPNQLKKAT
jgi:hypothetical protein